MKQLKKFMYTLCSKRDISVQGLTELYRSHIGEVGQHVIVKLGAYWATPGKTFIARIVKTDIEGIRVECVGDTFPGPETILSTFWCNDNRSRFYLVPDGWLTHVDEPEAPPAPEPEKAEKTLFTVMCEYDAALASLQALKPGYDAAHKKFLEARVALGLELAKHQHL